MTYLPENPDIQIQKGREALMAFHNESLKFSNYNLTFDALLSQVGKKHPTIFLESFGMAIEALNTDGFFSWGKVNQAMAVLANKGQGRVPTNQTVFFQALSNRMQDIDWAEASGYVAVETGKAVLDGAQAVGDTILDTAKSLNTILPLLVIGSIVFIVIGKSKRLAA